MPKSNRFGIPTNEHAYGLPPISTLRHHFSEHSLKKSEIQKNGDASVHAEEG